MSSTEDRGRDISGVRERTEAQRVSAHRLLVVVSAPSGAGKTSLCEWVVTAVPGFAHSVSFTTRPARPDEADGRDYHFVNEATFRAMVDRGEFAEWAVVHGHLYGTSLALLQRHFAAGLDVILDIDTQGADILRRSHPDGVFVFVVPPSWSVLEERLRRRRSDAESEIQRRLQRAREEVKRHPEYQYVIVNDDFARAAEGLKAIILAERRRSLRVDLGFLHA
ncbi:MAG TPA: guanylate kinase [Candidatus Methylomirabilis sp.]